MTSKRQPRRRSLSHAKLDEMIEEATVDAYGGSEQTVGLFQVTNPSLLMDVKRFEKASLAGEYYESFGVNSKNYTQKSAGTSAWIAEYLRLLDRCVINAKKTTGSESAEGGYPAFEKLLIEDQDLSALRTEYARRPLSERRAAAEWAYDEVIANSMFTAALARVDPD